MKSRLEKCIFAAMSSFFIKRMDTSGYIKAEETPQVRLPLTGFIYITSGEVLIEVEDKPFLCQSGQLLLIPMQRSFTIRYYRDAIGFTGGFATAILPDNTSLLFLSEPLHQGFWFDEGAFISELFNMLTIASQKGDMVFIEKGLDLLLSRIKQSQDNTLPPAVSKFLETVFNPAQLPGNIAFYADKLCISENYLSRLVKKHTGRSVGEWIDIVRIQRAKRLLAETRTPIIDIAGTIGIEDQSYFSRLFKKETGMTPSSFRKKMQG